MANINSSDGKTPVYDPDIYHRLWFIGDIWLGSGEAEGKYVVKQNDLVYELNGNSVVIYKVLSINEDDLSPNLVEVLINTNEKSTISATDVLFGVTGSSQADTYRVYVDKSTTPYTMCVDQRLQVNGSMTNYAKIFKGAVLTDEGEVVSKTYDNSGNYVSDSVQLEKVAINNHDNYAVKSIPPCKTTHDLVDGEIVTVVLYSDDGGVVSKKQLLVENTAFIRTNNKAVKYITNITLESLLLDEYDSHLLRYPINLPINSFNIVGVVNYSDGSSVRLPIDGNKFQLAGLNNFVSTIVGQKANLVLMYTLDKDEVAYGAVVGENKTITEAYSLLVDDPDQELSVKLFVYPKWISEKVGYKLNFYMYTQDRSLWYDVTDQVSFSSETQEFDGMAYGYRQQKTVYINMKDVSPTYEPYIHVQNIDVVLLRKPSTTREGLWKVKSDANSAKYYGENIFAVVSDDNNGVYTVSLRNGKDTVDEWLESVYNVVEPMYDPALESTFPTPTHFYITVGTEEYRFDVRKDWDRDIKFMYKPVINSNAKIRFTREIGGDILHLTTVEMPLVE